MFCSIIIPTIGRDTLTRAVSSVLDQTFTSSQYEVVVVNDSGRPLPPADWQKSSRVRILHTYQRERSVARNAGAAITEGNYLGFLDDDDWLLPGALNSLWELSQQAPNAAWLYGAIQVIDEATSSCIAEVNSSLNGNCFAQIMGGAWVPIQASIISSSAFFQLGGFNPLINSTEDLDLCRRIAFFGEFANTNVAIGCLSRGDLWRTSTDYDQAPVNTLLSRNNILAEAEAFSRLMASAKKAYWYGRIPRVYLSTAKWNWQHLRIITSISRLLFGTMSMIRAGHHLFSREFWQGVRAHHVPNSLHQIERSKI